MGVCESNKNQKAISNNTQNVPNTTTPVNKTQATTLVNNRNTAVPQSSNNKVITNNRNTISGEEQKNDGVSFDRNVSMGSSLNNEDSIGYIQTRNTVAV